MRETPQISFVVPAYNEEVRLPACIAAIQAELARTRCSAELLVVNNASTDRTAEVAAGLSGVVVVEQPAKGLVQARSAGFAAASGALVANIDADTLLPTGWLERVLREFERDPKLVALSGPYDYHDVPPRLRWTARAFYGVAYGVYCFNRYVLGIGSMVQGGNFVVRRQSLEQGGGFDQRFIFYGEDTDIARRMSRVGRIKFTWALMAKSSGRRLEGDGLVRTGLRYSANYVWATFLHRPFTKGWNDYR